MNEYQHVLLLPGPLFGLIVLVGLVGIVIPRRRSPAAVFLWVSAAILIVLPTAEHEYTYRYVIPAVPLACMAAALAFRRQDREAVPAEVTTAGASATVSGAAPARPNGQATAGPGAVAAPPGPGAKATPPGPDAKATPPGPDAEAAPPGGPGAQTT
jgi:peptidoglycan/LPS O-acetylase OafA/YrhL